MTELWPAIPLATQIIERIARNNNAVFDDELLRDLQTADGTISLREFNKALMRLELRGIIQVNTVTRSKRRIELV
ncbi:MAG: hypothetical protein NWE83_05900 [Candidatus Bathyarchaeota archaeon]|nr:hypothetical protein [Candidatus Bathyarchaeota archaeon]